MGYEIRIYERRELNAAGQEDIVLAVHCRCGHEASVAVPVAEAAPQVLQRARDKLRQAYLDHRGQMH